MGGGRGKRKGKGNGKEKGKEEGVGEREGDGKRREVAYLKRSPYIQLTAFPH